MDRRFRGAAFRLAMLFAAYLAIAGPARAWPAETPTPDSAKPDRRLALLVGCTSYPKLPNRFKLDGPGNDVKLFRGVLTSRYGFGDADITELSDARGGENTPTREHIVRELNDLVKRTGKGDQVVVFLVGHGSRQLDDEDPQLADELDGCDEIYLPRDVEWSTDGKHVPNAILDDEIHDWAQAITEKGASLWLICDFCCSGTAIRGDSGETARNVDETELGIPRESIRQAYVEAAQRQKGAETRHDDFDLTRTHGNFIAFYAAQSAEKTYETTLPRLSEARAEPRERHGYFSYALCRVMQEPGADALSYRDLMDLVGVKYAAWRVDVTPFCEGADLDRLVLGSRRARLRLKIESGSAKRGWKINGGQIHSLANKARLAVREHPTDQQPIGYVEVTDVRLTECTAISCAHAGLPANPNLPLGALCDLVYVDYSDLRLQVAVDIERPGATEDEKRRLAALKPRLEGIANDPRAMFRLVEFVDAEWIIQAREGNVQLLNKAIAAIADPVRRPADAAVLVVDPAGDVVSGIQKELARVFRAQNLLVLASDRRLSSHARGDEAPRAGAWDTKDLKVEMLRFCGKSDTIGACVDQTAGTPRFEPGQRIAWRVSNIGPAAVDITLLYIDAQYNLVPIWPRLTFSKDNRLKPGESHLTPPACVTKPFGKEQLIVIAERRGDKSQRNFSFLAAVSASSARDAERSRGASDDATRSPLGQLLQYAAFNESEGPTRGRDIDHADPGNCQMTFVEWIVEPPSHNAQIGGRDAR